MKVSELITLLQGLNKPDTEVLIYNETGEEHGEVDRVDLISKQEDMRYDKGDQPSLDTYSKGEVVIISGYCNF